MAASACAAATTATMIFEFWAQLVSGRYTHTHTNKNAHFKCFADVGPPVFMRKLNPLQFMLSTGHRQKYIHFIKYTLYSDDGNVVGRCCCCCCPRITCLHIHVHDIVFLRLCVECPSTPSPRLSPPTNSPPLPRA